jgi:hypothetical protein
LIFQWLTFKKPIHTHLENLEVVEWADTAVLQEKKDWLIIVTEKRMILKVTQFSTFI